MHEREVILDRMKYLCEFPRIYPVRIKGRRFRRHRWFEAGNWLLYYRVVENTIYIWAIWPARIP
jgi:ParE toxin of type II toxin-antitoxin system, parDE